jgi:3-oxoacyl-[acyl-carrier-protein] synthase II
MDACRGTLVECLVPAIWCGLERCLPATTLSAACASALVAVGLARERIRWGLYDACLVVAVDVLSRIGYAGFRQIGAMSALGCRPFQRDRDGTTVGEGAVAFLLARAARGSAPASTVRVAGFGQSCDGRHVVEPSADGLLIAMEAALRDAQLSPQDIRTIYWHGSGTAHNDAAEAEAARRLFGASSPPCTATKGTFGHTMGASAGLSLLAAAESVRTGLLPPVGGLTTSDFPWLDLVLGEPRLLNSGPTMVVALGFGGINVAVVLAPPEAALPLDEQ